MYVRWINVSLVVEKAVSAKNCALPFRYSIISGSFVVSMTVSKLRNTCISNNVTAIITFPFGLVLNPDILSITIRWTILPTIAEQCHTIEDVLHFSLLGDISDGADDPKLLDLSAFLH